MHHYTLYTADSLTTEGEIQRLWRLVIPEEALNHSFLTQGLLAMSALHLTAERPAERSLWTPLALKHQSIALASFRSTLPSANQENCTALFALSILISITSQAFCSYGTVLVPGRTLPLSDVIEPFTLIRGVGQLLAVASHWLIVGPLKSMIIDESYGPFPSLVVGTCHELFDNLYRMIREMCPELEIQKELDSSVHNLEYVFSQTIRNQGRPRRGNPGLAWQWPHRVSQGYASLLRESHGGALVIYAHFALLSYAWKDRWYLNGWAERAIHAILNNLSPCWLEWVRWLVEQVENGFPIFNEVIS